MKIRMFLLAISVATSAFCCGCAWTPFTLFGGGPQEKGEIGEPVFVDLFYNEGGFGRKEKAETKAIVTITKISVSSVHGFYYLTVDVTYENLGRKQVEWGYGNAYLVDSEKRMYSGNDYFDFVDLLEKPSRPFHFVEAEPGESRQNFVVFKTPKSAFDRKLYFGFVSVIDPDSVQGKILVFDNSRSTYSFSKDRSFTSIAWSD